ncbi:penicillin acylase family protein [Streptomyces sp. NPDC093149]|uniref:penicillin acylase family protein n=1 Tax=Streptomyces sp. NPDC093149 TaxID=3366031 RepID=UPI0037FFF38D
MVTRTLGQPPFSRAQLGGPLHLRNRLGLLAISGLALFTVSASLPPAPADGSRTHRPSGGGLSAVIRYTEYGIPHVVAKDYANLGFGNGWAQAADQVCTLADGSVTLRGERSRYFGPQGAPGGSLSSATKNLSSDLYFRSIAAPRSMRTRGAIEDVSAMAARGRLTVADLQEQQFANRAPAGDLSAADLARACAALPGGGALGTDGKAVDVSAACDVLRRWDRKLDTGSRGALLFDRFWRRAATVSPAELWKVPFSLADPVGTPNTLNTSAPGVTRALADAVAELRAAGIALDAPLGRHQTVVRNGKRIPLGGGTESLGVWNKTEPVWDAAAGGYADVSAGSSYIQAVGWNGTGCPVARTLLTYSQSSNPRSPHYSDQTELYSGERWVTSRFREKDILRSPVLRVVRASERR